MEGIEYPVKRSIDINLSEVIKNLTGNNVICFECKNFDNDHFGCTVLKLGEIDIRSECERYEPIEHNDNKEEVNNGNEPN